MRILITAGNTQTPLDDVRVITNVFSGRTGSLIATAAHARGHSVCLLTSNPELLANHSANPAHPGGNWDVQSYRTFDDLLGLMERLITSQKFDAIIHSAAVSDFQLAGTYAPAPGTCFDTERASWQVEPAAGAHAASTPTMLDASAGKIKSGHRELWLRLVPTPKLIDFIRQPWGFKGQLVKFKLEVGLSDEELLRIAEASRTHSQADLMVANTRSGMHQYALLGPVNGQYVRLTRTELADRLLDQLEAAGEN
ncbi:MAG: phosphopantothenate--cysteine ligase [Planctomycetaceae bacterium]|nr:phosphopantothenate--cysteine ligase [Planctomycetaceae bacterium]